MDRNTKNDLEPKLDRHKIVLAPNPELVNPFYYYFYSLIQLTGLRDLPPTHVLPSKVQ